jgi:hypothetical protein
MLRFYSSSPRSPSGTGKEQVAQTIHIDCYVGTDGMATMVQAFLEKGPREHFYYTCLAQRLARDRPEIEKAATSLRLTRSVVVEPAVCSECDQARVPIQARPTT